MPGSQPTSKPLGPSRPSLSRSPSSQATDVLVLTAPSVSTPVRLAARRRSHGGPYGITAAIPTRQPGLLV